MKKFRALGVAFGLCLLAAVPTTAAPVKNVKIFLVALDDGGKLGRKIGCGDSLVPISMAIRPTKAPLRSALEKLLSTPPTYIPNPVLKNFWKGRDLKLNSVSVQSGTATIHFTGDVFVAGVCDQPRITEQVEALALQFPSVKRVQVFMGTQTLAEAIR